MGKKPANKPVDVPLNEVRELEDFDAHVDESDDGPLSRDGVPAGTEVGQDSDGVAEDDAVTGEEIERAVTGERDDHRPIR